jgi:energy-converting hydrogenase Eha subunit E
MNYLFLLLILAASILLSVIALRSKAFSSWKPVFSAIAAGALFNVMLSFAFSNLNIVQYQSKYLSAGQADGIPLEQVLLSFALPFAFLVIYGFLNSAKPITKTDKFSLSISNVLMGLSIAMLFFAYNKGLAVVTFSLLLLLLFYLEYRNQLRFMLPFYRAYAVALILFLVVFVPINALSIYRYTKGQTIELSIAYIPFEAYFSFLTMGLVTVFAYELSKRRN